MTVQNQKQEQEQEQEQSKSKIKSKNKNKINIKSNYPTLRQKRAEGWGTRVSLLVPTLAATEAAKMGHAADIDQSCDCCGPHLAMNIAGLDCIGLGETVST